MDNWREDKTTGRTHEPHDATLQLDGLGRRLADLSGEPVPPSGSEGPVFVDESGRRSKTFRRLGWVLATGCAAYAVTLVLAVLGGNASAPRLPVFGPEEKARSEQVEDAPAPDSTVHVPSDDVAEPDPGASDPDGPAGPGGAAPSAASVVVPAGNAKDPSASRPADPATASGGSGPVTEPVPTTPAAEPPVDPPPSPDPEPTAPTAPPAESPAPPVEEESTP
ncbi:hypothetical protein ACFV2V_07555 [Streptomyces sp. NPDC059698]|uniref:hypothetical protein n=1 Tax=unclassified Streptomyces TaxID=2593676 RepID=UPI00093BC5D6|nr:hypothetical protein [Streptomyces sp. CB02366]OKJ39601.1 hypothetical protein AMK24_08250 [Streptomyces sp. CB02366]